MIDIKLLRDDTNLLKESLAARGAKVDLEPLLQLDAQRRDLVFEIDECKKERNDNSALIGKGKLEPEERQKLVERTKELGQKIKDGDQKIKEIEEQLDQALKVIPNLLDASTPIGKSEEDNPEVRRWGQPTQFAFPPKHHADLAEALGVLDFKRGVKLAHSRFTLITGVGAKLERALINFMVDLHTNEHGYTEFMTPLLVNQESMTGTGQLPKFEEDLFKTTTGLYLIPTAEVSLTNIHAGEILKEEELPKHYTAFSPCFRSEAGSYGKDTRGYLRQHQFNKVEMVKLALPEQSMDELEAMVKNAEEVLKRLELPYRVISLCSGDIGFSSCKTYDLEVWMPGEDKYREISSCSNCWDFQARRASIKYKPKEGGKPRFVHTLNGSGLAVGRTLAALLENYQQADGRVKIPKVLQPYMGGLTEIIPSL